MFRVILHLDMDAFYASVEHRDDPRLKGRPVTVGSPLTQRGVVCAASYEVRKFGVRSAMPSATAGRLCPNGVFLRPHMEAYREESKGIMAIVDLLAGGMIRQVSVDEACLMFPPASRVPIPAAALWISCSSPSGIVSVEAMARRFDLWKKGARSLSGPAPGPETRLRAGGHRRAVVLAISMLLPATPIAGNTSPAQPLLLP